MVALDFISVLFPGREVRLLHFQIEMRVEERMIGQSPELTRWRPAVPELVGRQGELPADIVELRELFAAGLAAYRNRDWETADRRFAECLARKADDGPAAVFRQRLELLRASPPAADWDGVWRLTEK